MESLRPLLFPSRAVVFLIVHNIDSIGGPPKVSFIVSRVSERRTPRAFSALFVNRELYYEMKGIRCV